MQLQHDPHRAVSALAAYLQAGCSSEAVSHPTPGARLVRQVLSIGHKLTQLHQSGHIPQLLALAGGAADTLGAAFLKVHNKHSVLLFVKAKLSDAQVCRKAKEHATCCSPKR